MNTYRAEFFARCPVNDARVHYHLTIVTDKVLSVEDLNDTLDNIGPALHEDIADMLAQVAGRRLDAELQAWVHGTADLPVADLLAAMGVQSQPERAGLAASLGLAALSVCRRPRVALFSTGDELVLPGTVPPDT